MAFPQNINLEEYPMTLNSTLKYSEYIQLFLQVPAPFWNQEARGTSVPTVHYSAFHDSQDTEESIY